MDLVYSQPSAPVLDRRPAPDDSVRLAGAALGYLTLLGIACVTFVWTRGGQRLDGVFVPRAERGGGYQQRTSLAEPALAVLSFIGDAAILAVLLLAVLVVGALTKRFWAGVAGVAIVLCSVGAARILKTLLWRPDLDVLGSTTHNSFPSGHVSAAMALLLAFLLVVPPWARWWLAVPGVVAVSAVASATMIMGWHRFSDTVGGILLASALCCVGAAVLTRLRGVSRVDTARRGPFSTAKTVVGGLAGVLITIMALLTDEGLFSAMVAATGVSVLITVSVLSLLDAWWAGEPRPVLR
jgi:membrane-associated phospholipid phosphatase